MNEQNSAVADCMQVEIEIMYEDWHGGADPQRERVVHRLEFASYESAVDYLREHKPSGLHDREDITFRLHQGNVPF